MSLRRKRVGSWVFVGIVLAFLFFPLITVVLFSFHSSPRMTLPFEGFSLRWYVDVLSDPLIVAALGRTMTAAVSTGVISATLGLTAALGLVAARQQVRAGVTLAALVPLTFPALLYAIGLAIFYREAGVDFSLLATIGGHTIIALPFVFLVLSASLSQFRFSLLEAARDLGANTWVVFRTVTFPLLLPAILGASLLAMALSVDEFVIAFFTAGQEKTLPMLLYSRLNQGLNPSLNAMGTILLVLTTGLAFFAARRTSKEGL